MLLHKKRVEGALMGLGYQNPYAHENLSPLDLQPLTYNDYVTNLDLDSQIYDTENVMTEKNEYKISVGLNPELELKMREDVEKTFKDAKKRLEVRDEEEKKQAGQGLDDEQSGILDKIFKNLKVVSNYYSSEAGPSTIKNYYGKIINPDKDWRPGYAGEKHSLIDGSTANYLGPGTKIRDRLQRGDPPLDGLNGLDAQAKTHDIDYMNAKNLSDVRKADLKFIKNINQAEAPEESKKMINTAMRAKIKSEDIGILDENKFTNLEIADNEDIKISGGGLKKVRVMGKYPDSYIRQKIMKQYKKSRKKLMSKI